MPKARQYEPNITNVYCTNCGLAKYNNLTISIKKNLGNLHISKNKKLENYFCNKCNSNKNILMNHFFIVMMRLMRHFGKIGNKI